MSPEAMNEVRKALREYESVVANAGLAKNAEKTYILHSTNFVRWLEGTFEPGGTIKGK